MRVGLDPAGSALVLNSEDRMVTIKRASVSARRRPVEIFLELRTVSTNRGQWEESSGALRKTGR